MRWRHRFEDGIESGGKATALQSPTAPRWTVLEKIAEERRGRSSPSSALLPAPGEKVAG